MLEEGGVVLPSASIPIVAQTLSGLQEMVEEYLKRFGLVEAFGGGARALVEDGRTPAPATATPQEVRAALFQAYYFRLMRDEHGIDLGDFHGVPAIPYAIEAFRLGIEEMTREPMAETASTIRSLMGDSAKYMGRRPGKG